MNGVFAVNKPSGISSFGVVAKIRRALQPLSSPSSPSRRSRLKVGHGGTLDPFATGVIVIGVGDGCKALFTYLKGTKEYIAKAKMGQEMDSMDKTGRVLQEKDYCHVTREMVEAALPKFTGDILQTPPMFSALSRGGKRLYELARKGQHVELQPRPVQVHSLELLSWDSPYFTLQVSSGAGMYVRRLVHDICEGVGTCGYVAELHRTRHGAFTEDMALTEEQWTPEGISKALIPIDDEFFNRLPSSSDEEEEAEKESALPAISASTEKDDEDEAEEQETSSLR
ncbi:TruB pseudouridine (psi) synthase 1 [Balamuthia mandrillaris]